MKNRIRINFVSYHRNGSGGTGFFACNIDLTENGQNFNNLIATFETEENEKGNDNLLWQSCRITNPLNLENNFRGDVIGLIIQNVLREKDAKFYNLIGLQSFSHSFK